MASKRPDHLDGFNVTKVEDLLKYIPSFSTKKWTSLSVSFFYDEVT